MQTIAGTSIEIILSGKLESGTDYYGRMMCVNYNLTQSEIVDFSWT